MCLFQGIYHISKRNLHFFSPTQQNNMSGSFPAKALWATLYALSIFAPSIDAACTDENVEVRKEWYVYLFMTLIEMVLMLIE